MRISIIVLLALCIATAAYADKPAATGKSYSGDRVGGETIETATVIASLPYGDVDDTCAFANDYDEVCPYSGSLAGDAVYAYTPVVGNNNIVTITTCNGTAYDSKLFVYQDMATPGAPYACNDDECANYEAEIANLYLAPGHTYYIVVDGWSSGCGTYVLDVTGDDPPVAADADSWGGIKALFE